MSKVCLHLEYASKDPVTKNWSLYRGRQVCCSDCRQNSSARTWLGRPLIKARPEQRRNGVQYSE